MLFKKKKSKKTKLTIQEINITPLMDVLTVLLFFLIKIFTVNSMNISSPQDIELPSSLSEIPPEESVTLLVSNNSIRTTDKILATIKDGNISKDQLVNNGRIIKGVATFLESEMNKRNAIYKDVKDKSLIPAGKLLIHADKKVPFKVLKYVLYTATNKGYGDYQFLTSKD